MPSRSNSAAVAWSASSGLIFFPGRPRGILGLVVSDFRVPSKPAAAEGGASPQPRRAPAGIGRLRSARSDVAPALERQRASRVG